MGKQIKIKVTSTFMEKINKTDYAKFGWGFRAVETDILLVGV